MACCCKLRRGEEAYCHVTDGDGLGCCLRSPSPTSMDLQGPQQHTWLEIRRGRARQAGAGHRARRQCHRNHRPDSTRAILTPPCLLRVLLLLPAVYRGGAERVEQPVAVGGACSSPPVQARSAAAWASASANRARTWTARGGGRGGEEAGRGAGRTAARSGEEGAAERRQAGVRGGRQHGAAEDAGRRRRGSGFRWGGRRSRSIRGCFFFKRRYVFFFTYLLDCGFIFI